MDDIVLSSREAQAKVLGSVLQVCWPFLPRAAVLKWCRECRHAWRERRWTPLVSLWACVWKQMQGGASARDVEDWIASMLGGQASGGADGHDFCAARARLPLGVFVAAVRHTGAEAVRLGGRLWRGWPVRIVDGSTLQAPRSQPNSRAFGHHRNVHGRSALPLVRVLLQVCAGTGAVLDAVVSGVVCSEMQLFKRLLGRLPAGELELLDRGFSSYLALSRIRERGSHALARLHQSRQGRCATRLGRGDELQEWRRPKPRDVSWPDWAVEAPQSMEVRVIERQVRRKGYRTWTLRLCTTLLDPALYPADELAALYLERWFIELDFRTLKGEYALDRLSGKTPAVVRREVYSGLLAYNLVRAMMAETGRAVRRLSAERARMQIIEMSSRMAEAPTLRLPALRRALLVRLGHAALTAQERPPEPRALVVTPRKFPILQGTRKQWRKQPCAA